MTDAFLLETKFFGDVGLLYPYDVRYDEHDRAFCNPLPDGQAQFRVQAEPELAEATLVYNDGSVQGAPLEPILAPPDDNRRFVYWQTTIRPAARRLRYSFAFKNHRGQPVYFCRHGIDHAVEPLDRWQLDLDAAAPFETPEWMRGAPVYQIFPDRFANGDPSNDPPDCAPWGTPPRWFEFQGGDLQGIARRLDYLQELGVEVLYLNPIFTSPSTHKYDTADYYQVDPAFGGNEALRTLVDELHRRDMRILLDASFNHCHPRFFAFQDLVKNGPASPYADWFTIYEYPVVLRYRPEQLTGYWKKLIDVASEHLGLPVLALDKADTDGPDVSLAERPAFAPTYEAWYNVPNMPKLNLSHPATRQYFLDVTAYWLREFHIDGWRMDVARHIAPDFWQDFRRVAKATRPDCYLLSEIWGDTSPWLQGDMFDATMNYFLRDLSLGYFAQQTTSTPEFVDGLLRMLALYAPQVQAVTHNLLSSHDTERFLTMAGGDLARLKLATLLQFTLPGAPGLYYGDEIGMEGGSDPDCRRAFPWHQPKSWRRDVLEMVKTLIHLRKTHLALRHGDFYLVWQGEDAFAFLRRYEGQRVLIVVNRGAALERLALPVESSAPQVVWGAGRVMFEKEERVILESAAESATIISV